MHTQIPTYFSYLCDYDETQQVLLILDDIKDTYKVFPLMVIPEQKGCDLRGWLS